MRLEEPPLEAAIVALQLCHDLLADGRGLRVAERIAGLSSSELVDVARMFPSIVLTVIQEPACDREQAKRILTDLESGFIDQERHSAGADQ